MQEFGSVVTTDLVISTVVTQTPQENSLQFSWQVYYHKTYL